jgi:hypothetical protein
MKKYIYLTKMHAAFGKEYAEPIEPAKYQKKMLTMLSDADNIPHVLVFFGPIHSIVIYLARF